MRAAVCRAFGTPLAIEEIELAAPRRGEVRVRIGACAICQSDVHYLRGDWGGELPMVAGHEAAGVVEALGHGVRRLAPGDHVVVTLLRACGHCPQCAGGRPFDCEQPPVHEPASPLSGAAGEPIVQGLSTAAFAEQVVVHESQLCRVPRDLPLASLALLGCAVITGLGAVTRTAAIESASRVAVIGCGGVGLGAVQGAALSGAAAILAVDIAEPKLEAARRLGATHTCNARHEDPVETALALTGGSGLDYAFATAGSPQAITQAFTAVRRGGTAVVVGMPASDEVMVPINTHHLTEDRRLIGSKMGSTRLAIDIPRLVDLYRAGRLKLDEMVSGRYPLERINEAIADLRRGEALRNVICFP